MKRYTLQLILVVLMFAAGCGRAQDAAPLPQWRAIVTVVDEAAQPVAGAAVTIGYYVPPPPDETIAMGSIKGMTDTNGVFSAFGRTGSTDLFFGAGKEGYYRSHLEHAFHEFKENDPAKWNPKVTLLLKKIINPIPMYAKHIRELPPVMGKAIGYDLEAGDWVTPHGKGTRTDVFFTVDRDKRAEDDWDFKVVVSFPNKGEGIQPFTLSELEKSSGYPSAYEAPENGYEPQWINTQSRRPGEPSVYSTDKNLRFFVRLRTILDEKGRVKSANYGKIHGDFMDFSYFLNPESNSRNVEFDSAKNLLKN